MNYFVSDIAITIESSDEDNLHALSVLERFCMENNWFDDLENFLDYWAIASDNVSVNDLGVKVIDLQGLYIGDKNYFLQYFFKFAESCFDVGFIVCLTILTKDDYDFISVVFTKSPHTDCWFSNNNKWSVSDFKGGI